MNNETVDGSARGHNETLARRLWPTALHEAGKEDSADFRVAWQSFLA
ncbi:hypothetical protein P9239_06665 [Caballeronia sp. LZ062]|nr:MULTISPECIES: hypothetical protein [unclassified Caballeronia]MDR5855439.1 hypothetical protein [Caballeronia sp. LZ050]MDR5870033.1 hypothetical protein [Caballeronia sp. LZ062]